MVEVVEKNTVCKGEKMLEMQNRKVVLVTGGSQGIGASIVRTLARKGYSVILNYNKSEEAAKNIQLELQSSNINIEIYKADVSKHIEVTKLINYCIEKYHRIDVLINNAGFGVFGNFHEIDLEKEIQLINTNITALHILTKLFLQDMKKNDRGYILNVASIAGFMPGPLMSTYYASKSYVTRLSQSIREELRRAKSNVKISILCPGPVGTNFNNVANVKFNSKSLPSEYVAKYAVNKLLKNKFYIIPGFQIKILRAVTKIIPDSIIGKFAYKVQERKYQ